MIAHDFTFESIDGEPLPLMQFAGSALMVVNTASRCEFTRQYSNLQSLWEDYKDRGLVVIGVPSNDFAGQEPGSEADVKAFCETKYGVTFPLTAKTAVKGRYAHPFYRWAATQFGWTARPRWNFHKYLVTPDGQMAAWFSTLTSPNAPKVLEQIEKVLPAADQEKEQA